MSALALLSSEYPQVLWKERADEYIFHVVQHHPSCLATRTYQDMASTLLWMAKGSFGRAHRPEALRALLVVLGHNDLTSLRSASLAVWYFAHNHVDNANLGSFEIMNTLVAWLAVVVLAKHKRISSKSSSKIRQFVVQIDQNTEEASVRTISTFVLLCNNCDVGRLVMDCIGYC